MEEERYCPECGHLTMQAPSLYDPDDETAGEVWVCSQCGECVDIVEN